MRFSLCRRLLYLILIVKLSALRMSYTLNIVKTIDGRVKLTYKDFLHEYFIILLGPLHPKSESLEMRFNEHMSSVHCGIASSQQLKEYPDD